MNLFRGDNEVEEESIDKFYGENTLKDNSH